jgi:DNA-directed RNA polymerase specialized sigma24 family protein
MPRASLLRKRREALDADSLRIITRALSAKLRADPSFSETFIRNNVEDLVAQGVLEYERKRQAGEEVVNPGGLVVHAAYRRAVDQLRVEGREVHGEASETILALAGDPQASTDSVALGRIEAQQLHEAIGTLTEAQRQALSALYFDEEPVRAAAAALGTTRSTLCRRRDDAIRVLRERFAIPEQVEPGDSYALEIGLAAHLSLAVGTAAKLAFLAPLGAAAERLREFFARLLLSGGGGVGEAAGASIPKAIGIGICGASTVAVCTVVAVGPGLGLLGAGGGGQVREQAAARQILRPAGSTTAPTLAPRSAAKRHAARTTRPHRSRHRKRRASTQGARHKAASESASSLGIESAVPEPSVEPVPSGSSESRPSPDEIANEQFGP